jgi:hypothetical protein
MVEVMEKNTNYLVFFSAGGSGIFVGTTINTVSPGIMPFQMLIFLYIPK